MSPVTIRYREFGVQNRKEDKIWPKKKAVPYFIGECQLAPSTERRIELKRLEKKNRVLYLVEDRKSNRKLKKIS